MIMGRRPRNYYAGGIYHLIQRGHNRSFIFNEQLDKAMFLDQVRETINAHPCRILYYVLMDNHYHIVVEMLATPVDEIMRRINRTYSGYYNLKYHCTGTVFGGRYKSYPVLNTAYLIKLIEYIAYNPVKAGIVKKVSDYRWCAHLDLLTERQSLVDRNRLYLLLGGTPELGLTIYTHLFDDALADLPEPRQSDFIQSRRSDTLETLLHESLPPGLTLAIIRSPTRQPEIVAFRRTFARQAFDKGYTTSEIAAALNVTARSVRGWLE